jgi:hypothetical protein
VKMDVNQFKAFMEVQQQQFNEMMKKLQAPATETAKTTTALPNMKALEVEKGDINQNWKLFRENFESYMSVARMPKNEEDDERQQFNMLMLVIGDTAKIKFKGLGLKTEDKNKQIEEILNIIEACVKEEIPVLLERLKFYEDYVKRVEKAANMCDFRIVG